MGSENSKNDDEQKSQRNNPKEVFRRFYLIFKKRFSQRLYTEDEIQRALANQKRMFEAKQLNMQTSSGIYPNLEAQNLNTIRSPSSSNAVHHSLTPSAPPESELFPLGNTTASRETYQQTSPDRPPLAFQRSTTPSTGPSQASPIFAGSHQATPSQASPIFAGSHQATPSVTRSSRAFASSAGPSSITHASIVSAGPSHATPLLVGPSHAFPSSVGPSHATPSSTGAYKRNDIPFQAPKTRSRSRCNQNIRNSNSIVSCVTCNGQLVQHIYQCTNGHSSCFKCKSNRSRCGKCTEQITDMRNITLESTLADLNIDTEDRIQCPNAGDGCHLKFKREQIENHLEECPFNIISCPMMEYSGDCSWKGMIKQLVRHFNDSHPIHRQADVNKEMDIVLLEIEYKVMHLVNIGYHKFLVHIQVDPSLNNIYFVTQYLGTNVSASKWTYEWHVYNKKTPRRKFEYIDICKSNSTPISEIIKCNNCAVLNMTHANSFLDNGKLTFKFYMKKNIDRTSN